MEKHINKEMCAKCGGACCKQTGCMYLPQDFESMEYDDLKSIIEEGNISITGQVCASPFGGWTYVLYLKARSEDSEIIDLFPEMKKCKMLTENGCFYDDEKRPSGGLAVKPTKIGGPCPIDLDDGAVYRAYEDYQDVLKGIVQDLYGNPFFLKKILEKELKKCEERLLLKEENDNNLDSMDMKNKKYIEYSKKHEYQDLCDIINSFTLT